MISETTVIKIGTSFYMRLKPDLVNFLGVDENSKMLVKDEEKSKGKFISAWKKEE